MEIKEGKLYRINEGGYAGRKYLIERVEVDSVFAVEGWWKYRTYPDRPSPEDTWEWSPDGPRSYANSHFESVQPLGDPPEVGEPRFRYRWGRD